MATLGFTSTVLTIVVLASVVAGLVGRGSWTSWLAVVVVTPLIALYDYRLYFLIAERRRYPNLRHWTPAWFVSAVQRRRHR